jgi:hypothetical protein
MDSLDIQSQMVAGFLVFSAANCIRLDVSLDTIPSVLGEHKPLQVVRGVKNKYLFSRLFFAGRVPQIDGFWCIAGRQKKQRSCAVPAQGKPSVDAPLQRRCRCQSATVSDGFAAAISDAPFDLMAGRSRRCFAGNFSQGG